MKNQEPEKINFQQKQLIILQDKLIDLVDTFDQSLIKCKGGNIVIKYCVNQKCKAQSVFTCSSKKCQCYKKHKKCKSYDICHTMLGIIKKIKEKQQLKQQANDLIDKTIQRLNQLRKNVIEQIQNHTLVLLTKFEEQFYKFFITREHSEVSKNQNFIHKANTHYDPENTYEKRIFSKIKNSIDIFQASNTKSMNILLDQVFYKVNYFRIVNKSSIINTSEDYQKMIKLLSRKVKSLTLLYKASEHDFKLKKYLQLCGEQTNTIIICRTDRDKIIGGYTPLKFNSNPNQPEYQQIKDPSNSTFLFSLTTGDKFNLRENHSAIIRRDKNGYILFGGGGFRILFEAHRVKNGAFYLGEQNFDFLHYTHNAQSNLIINGNQSHNFCVKQWEVIQVRFQNDSV